jgi:hypothetical protein
MSAACHQRHILQGKIQFPFNNSNTAADENKSLIQKDGEGGTKNTFSSILS